MRQLMISLDKNIINKDSLVARRMIQYGEKKELFIIVPNKEADHFDLSRTVHVQTTGGNKMAQFYQLIQIGKRLIKYNDIKEITTQDPFFTGLAGYFLQWWSNKKFKIALEIQVHGDFFGKIPSGKYYYPKWQRMLALWTLHRADTVRVVGQRIKQSILRLGIAENKIAVKSIQNDPQLIKNFPTVINLHSSYPGYEKIFLVLGRLEPVKNILWLLPIFQEVIKQKNYLLLIVGKGSEESDIRRQIQNLGLEKNVQLQNWTEDPYGYLKSADCILLPSLSEGYGVVPIEAEIIGTKVIMTDVGVANYELKPSERVRIVPVGDAAAFLDAILHIS